MNYKESINYLYSKAPMFQSVGKKGFKSGLHNTMLLDDRFGNPHRKYKTIHIAGTNGKGSTSHMLASILQEAGYKVGLYTSPHLLDFTERVRVNGISIPQEWVAKFISENTDTIEEVEPSFFEITTILAFEYFAQEEVDIAVIETGLGGRLDCTNIISPILSVITNISLDHTDILGNNIESIAKEKAGIIKPNTPVVIGEVNKDNECSSDLVFNEKAAECNSRIIFAEGNNFTNMESLLAILPLKGVYQKANLKTVLTAAEELKNIIPNITTQIIENGLDRVITNTNLQGRWQVLSNNPLTICDTGHNKGAFEYIGKELAKIDQSQLHIVIGFVADKNIDDVLKLLPQKAHYYFTQADIPRALPAIDLQSKASNFGLTGECYNSVELAIDATRENAKDSDTIFIGGSTFVVAEAIPASHKQ